MATLDFHIGLARTGRWCCIGCGAASFYPKGAEELRSLEEIVHQLMRWGWPTQALASDKECASEVLAATGELRVCEGCRRDAENWTPGAAQALHSRALRLQAVLGDRAEPDGSDPWAQRAMRAQMRLSSRRGRLGLPRRVRASKAAERWWLIQALLDPGKDGRP